MTTEEAIQIISIFLEIIGLGLALIEIKFPKFAQELEEVSISILYIGSFLISLISWISNKGKFRHIEQEQLTKKYKDQLGGYLVTIISICIVSTLMIFLGTNIGLNWFFYVYLIISISTFIWVFPLSIIYLNRYGNGNGIGVLGIILAGIGFLWNIYQTIDMFFLNL